MESGGDESDRLSEEGENGYHVLGMDGTHGYEKRCAVLMGLADSEGAHFVLLPDLPPLRLAQKLGNTHELRWGLFTAICGFHDVLLTHIAQLRR